MINLSTTFEHLSQELKKRNIRLSYQRLKVLEYMTQNHVHPTVEQIYSVLHKEVPTLSKTTIYNTLNTLMEANIVKPLNIEDNEVRYDIVMEDHGHFKCEACWEIFDFHVDTDSIGKEEELKGFKINSKDVYLKGICPNCLRAGKTNINN